MKRLCLIAAVLFDGELQSRLARWVVDAHRAGLSFGLRLPGEAITPATGNLQREIGRRQ